MGQHSLLCMFKVRYSLRSCLALQAGLQGIELVNITSQYGLHYRVGESMYGLYTHDGSSWSLARMPLSQLCSRSMFTILQAARRHSCCTNV